MDTDTTTEGEANTPNGEEVVETTEETTEEEVVKLPKAEYEKLNQTLGSLKREVKDLKKSTTKEPEQSKNEPDYGRLAYLQAKGIAHPDDQRLAQEEADRLKLPLTDVLEMEHLKVKLKTQQEDREAKAGTFKGGKRIGGATSSDVDYWVARGETPDNQELAEKVVNARMAQESKNKFSDTLYTG